MRSGIYDKNGIEVQEGDTLVFPYVDLKGRICKNQIDFTAKVEFKHGCFGYERATGFTPLMEWSNTKEGDYIPNKGNKFIILDEYPFWIDQAEEEK